jgi:hypothetical protein
MLCKRSEPFRFGKTCSKNKENVVYGKFNALLMNTKFISPVKQDTLEEVWQVVHQIVAPVRYRRDVMCLAHDTPMAGHLGVNKTCARILSHFYWLKLRKDISEVCKSCHVCQMVGKPNQKIPAATLQPILAFEEPFSLVLVDCVGPLPNTGVGNQYLLTIMCTSTRFPEAIPLRNIKAKTIVKALTKFFSVL